MGAVAGRGPLPSSLWAVASRGGARHPSASPRPRRPPPLPRPRLRRPMADLARLATAGLRLLPAEPAHRLAIRLLRLGLVPRDREAADPILATRAFGLGFNNDGLEVDADRLRRRRRGSGILGANLGKNKDSADAAADYRRGVHALARHADYLVVNVSSPNTPGLRALQGREPLDALLAAVQAARAEAVAAGGPPILLKIAPDLTAEDCRDIAEVVLARKLDGLIIGNTTITRPADLRGRHRGEAGGLSGRPLFPLATERLAEMYRLTGGRIPLIGTGGVASGARAYAKIRAGAALVQLYTGLVYEGPGLVRRIKRELAALLRRDGFAGVAAAVGADHRPVGAPGAGRRIG